VRCFLAGFLLELFPVDGLFLFLFEGVTSTSSVFGTELSVSSEFKSIGYAGLCFQVDLDLLSICIVLQVVSITLACLEDHQDRVKQLEDYQD